jgi:hypothetical protein
MLKAFELLSEFVEQWGRRCYRSADAKGLIAMKEFLIARSQANEKRSGSRYDVARDSSAYRARSQQASESRFKYRRISRLKVAASIRAATRRSARRQIVRARSSAAEGY